MASSSSGSNPVLERGDMRRYARQLGRLDDRLDWLTAVRWDLSTTAVRRLPRCCGVTAVLAAELSRGASGIACQSLRASHRGHGQAWYGLLTPQPGPYQRGLGAQRACCRRPSGCGPYRLAASSRASSWS